ncbi:hypothetical protein ACI65C_003993 [Semiaphis heraclei]
MVSLDIYRPPKYSAISSNGKNSVWGVSSLFRNLNSNLPSVKNKHQRRLNQELIGRNCTIYKYKSSMNCIRPSSNHLRKVNQKPPQNTMNKCGRLQFVNYIRTPMVDLLDRILEGSGKSVFYTIHHSSTGLMQSRIHTCFAKCEDLESYGCDSSAEKAIEDAAKKILEKISYTFVKNDDQLVNSMNSLSLDSKINEKFNNYIGILQEYCQAHRLDMPKYEYHQDNDIKNKKILYSVVCSAGPHKCTGIGISKQIAKTHAARLIYNQINSNYTTTSTSNFIKNKSIDFGQGLSRNEAKNHSTNINFDQIYHGMNNVKTPVNYIGKIQEICTARGWEFPKYEFHEEKVKEINVIHHSVICSLGPHKSKGVGNTKQVAKNQAAQLVFDQINLDPLKASVFHMDCACDKSNHSSNQNLRDVDPCEYIHQVKLLCNQLSFSKKECMQKLMRCYSLGSLGIDMSLFEFLAKLAHQEDLSITYERFSNNDNETQVYGVIYMHSQTIYGITNIGDGKTDAEAKNVIAKNILAFIKHTISMI